MRYSLTEQLISLGGDSMIKDEQGQDIYFVDGAAVSVGRKLKIKELNGTEAASIEQRLVALSPTFEIKVSGGKSARISRRLITITDQLKIDVPGGEDMEAGGNLLQHEYEIRRGGRVVAKISKAWVALTDSYGIEIDDGEDPVFLLACAVVIDEITDRRRR
jgi:uncharacterized protein YxjI